MQPCKVNTYRLIQFLRDSNTLLTLLLPELLLCKYTDPFEGTGEAIFVAISLCDCLLSYFVCIGWLVAEKMYISINLILSLSYLLTLSLPH